MLQKNVLNYKYSDRFFYSFIFLIWFILLGSKTIYEPFTWDDLHLIRIYQYEHLLESWTSNWDTGGVETPAYRPITVLLYHLQAYLFEENVIFHHLFSISLLFFLLHVILSFLKKLEIPSIQIFFILIILIFSKIFTTLVSWMILSQMILCYCIFFIVANFFQDWIKERKKSFFLIIIFLSFVGIFAREEIYHLPIFLFLLWLYHATNQNNFKNLKKILLPCSIIFSIVILHYFLRLNFVPEASQPDFSNRSILQFLLSGFSSGLPGGFKAYTIDEIVLKYLWISILFIIFLITIFKDNLKSKYFIKNLILLFIVILMTSPSLVKSRDFGIFLPTVFSLIIISNLIFNFKYLSKFKYFELFKYRINFLVLLIFFIGVIAGYNRSNQHLYTWNSNSAYTVSIDSAFLFHDRFKNVTIPTDRRSSKTKKLNEKNIFFYVTVDDIIKLMAEKKISDKVYIPRHNPLKY